MKFPFALENVRFNFAKNVKNLILKLQAIVLTNLKKIFQKNNNYLEKLN